MKIAIIGSGISGLTAAYLLNDSHDVTLFEAGDYIGGHTHTHALDGIHVDSGFIVYNEWTYPNFIKLLTRLKVETQETSMSFAVRSEEPDFEYGAESLSGIIAQKKNLLSPRFYQMWLDFVKFNKKAKLEFDRETIPDVTLDIYAKNFSRVFRDYYLFPIAASIWSGGTANVREMPARFFVRFFQNHGLLNVINRPKWRTIKNGSFSYIKPLTEKFAHKILLNRSVKIVTRLPKGVELQLENEIFFADEVIFACHSDQVLKILKNPLPLEREILEAIPYEKNEAILHSDISVLPKRHAAWSSWNYLVSSDKTAKAVLTYNMNILQKIDSPKTYLVTLNGRDQIDPAQIIKIMQYAHPHFTLAGIAAQKRHGEISGVSNIHYCGAYWRNGFHEDGVWSALQVTKHFGVNNL